MEILRVQDWLDQQVAETLYTTTTSLSELVLGVELLPKGRRKNSLQAGLSSLLDRLFGQRVLPFDKPAAARYATLVSHARATAITHQLATRK